MTEKLILVDKGGIPRRCRVDLFTATEQKVQDAIVAVESAGADPLLTDVVVLLTQAQEKLTQYYDTKLAQFKPETYGIKTFSDETISKFKRAFGSP